MKVLVIGLGSMGRRRIRLIKKYDPSIEIMGVDLSEARCRQAVEELQIQTATDLTEELAKGIYSCAFVTTSPLSHNKIIESCLTAGLHVFTELNLVLAGYEENQKLAEEKNLTLFLSSTFLYRQEVGYIRELVQNAGCPLSYNYHIGQYLPDWHPWEDYRDFFIGKKETNGCREILAIELPWLTDLFGKVTDYQVIKRRMTGLDIEYDDAYSLLLTHENGDTGILQVDVVCRKAVRNFELTGENLYLSWNGKPDGLNVYDIEKKEDQQINLYESVEHIEGYSANIIENAYFEEVRNFFEVVAGKARPHYSFTKDEQILKLIDAIEA